MGFFLAVFSSIGTGVIIFKNFSEIKPAVPISNITFPIAIALARVYAAFCISILFSARCRMVLINEAALKVTKSSSYLKRRMILLVHDKFCNSIALISKCLSIALISNLLQWINRLTFTLFNFCNIIIHPTIENNIFAILGFLVIIPDTLFIMSMIFIPNFLKNSAKKIENQFHSHEGKKTLKKFKISEVASLQIAHSRPVVSCGFFEVDLKFLFVLLTAQFSILIILAQFQVSGDLKTSY